MINLPSEPRLGSLVLTRNAAWKFVYRLPIGMSFPEGTTAQAVITDRAGGELAVFDATVGTETATWFETGEAHGTIPAGANFEMYVTLPDDAGVFKVLYGRVVRREPRFPLNPSVTPTFNAVQYEDLLNRSEPGPYWIARQGKVGMHPIADVPLSNFGMGVRNLDTIFGSTVTLYQEAAVLYYAAVRGDTVEITVGLDFAGQGDFTLVLCSNYTMKSWLGVRWRTLTSGDDTIQAVTGTGPTTYVERGSSVVEEVPTTGKLYTVRFSLPLSTLSVFDATDLGTPLLEWEDPTGLVPHGMGYRYVGAMWDSSLVSTGPVMYYWKAQDDV